jgi:type II secretory pathway component PulF
METRSKHGGWGELLLLGFALGGWALSAVHLAWLLWKFVPLHCAVFEGMQTNLPYFARLVISASNHFVRWLPFAVLAFPVILVASAALAGLAAWRLELTTRAVRQSLILFAFAGASFTVLASFGVVHAIQSVYDGAPLAPQFQGR